MKVYVTFVHVPAMSTLGYGKGYTDDDQEVAFVGDHRPMRDIGRALLRGERRNEVDPVIAEVDEHQLIPLWVAESYR